MRVSSRAVAWGLTATTGGLVAASLALFVVVRSGGDGLVDLPFTTLLVGQTLTFASVGCVLARARPENSVSWLFVSVGLFVAMYLFAEHYQRLALVSRPDELPLGEFAAWVKSWMYVPALGIFVTLLPQLFPTGRPLSRRWHPAVGLTVAASVGMALAAALQPGRIDGSVYVNPVGVDSAAHRLLDEAASSTYLLAALIAFASLVARWRRADTIERLQLKWFALFASSLPLFVLLSAVIEIVGVDEPLASVLSFGMASIAFQALPIATAISILRFRLYDIDLVINRTLVYGSLTGLLVATYLLSVIVFRLALDPVTGDSDLAVAGSTLAAAALFRPLRARIQAVVDRRFYRSRYDAARTVQDFSGRLRDELDLESLTADLRRVAHDTMAPAHVSLWLRGAP